MPSSRRSLATCLAVALTTASAAHADPVHLFVLKRAGMELSLERIAIGPGEVQVIPPSADIVDLVFPPGVGQSAGLLSPGDGRMFVARRAGDSLRVEVRASDGSKRQLPTRAIADLAAEDIRVSVTGEGGRMRAAFLIEGDREARRDVGPVANMFAGRLPAEVLGRAFVVQTETYRRTPGPPLSALVPLTVDRWPFVRATLPGGRSADFIVDIGAGTTVVDRALLPADATLEEASMTEYSATGRRSLKYAPGGATGQVQGVVGHATLDTLTLGPEKVADVTVDVMERMPDLFGRPVGGILGMDVMRRCDRLTLTLGGRSPSLRLGAPPADSTTAVERPFAIVGGHVLVEATVGGHPAHFILDTGAPTTFLDPAAARAAGVRSDSTDVRQAHGLDEGAIAMVSGILPDMALGGLSLHDVSCRISALPAFDSLRGEGQHVGLLGNDFLARFRSVEIDFARHTVRFVP